LHRCTPGRALSPSEEKRRTTLTAELLTGAAVSAVVCDDAPCSRDTAEEMARLQERAGHVRPRLIVRGASLEAGDAWVRLQAAVSQGAAADDDDATVVLLTHEGELSAVLGAATHMDAGIFRLDAGSVSVLHFPGGVHQRAVLRCTNYTAHFRRDNEPLTTPAASE
jgi:broad specificity phosphatase PhoE